MTSLTKIYHSAPYEVLSPLNESNNQHGRTILITGGSEGIGFEIATAFQEAQAAKIILLGRRKEALEKAVEQLKNTARPPDETLVIFKVCDISSKDDIKSLWGEFSTDNITIDVLVLNAASTSSGLLAENLLAAWGAFEMNVLANMNLTNHFIHQPQKNRRKKVLLNISSFMAHTHPAPAQGAYAASKAGFSNLLQHLADEISVENTQIISIHPGAILTEAARRNGFDDNTLPWDDKRLPGHFCVWAASESAKFLHGKFVWSNWDVTELMERASEIMETPGLLRIGLQGCEIVDSRTIFSLMRENAAQA